MTYFPSKKCQNPSKQLTDSHRLVKRCNSRNNSRRSQTLMVSGPQRTTTSNNTEQSHSIECIQTLVNSAKRLSLRSDKVNQTLDINQNLWTNRTKSYLPPTIELPQFPLFLVEAAGSHVAVCESEFERERVCVCMSWTAARCSVSRPAAAHRLQLSVASRWKTPTAPVTHAGLRGLTGLHLTPCLCVCE